MNESIGLSNLKEQLLDPLLMYVGMKLDNYRYYDVMDEEYLITNNKGVDIIGHQLELKFENNQSMFVGWESVEGWLQYSLCVSNKSFCRDVPKFIKQDDNWKRILGLRLTGFEVYGFIENKNYPTTYYYEPHLLVLKFDNEHVLGVGNFSSEDNFTPKIAYGDDIWIIFGWTSINFCINQLALEMLN